MCFSVMTNAWKLKRQIIGKDSCCVEPLSSGLTNLEINPRLVSLSCF